MRDETRPITTMSPRTGREYTRRRELNDEVHARPAGPLAPPLRLSHLAVLSGETGAEDDRAHVARLCQFFHAPVPPEGSVHFAVYLGVVSLKWERHTEFSTYTFYRTGVFDQPFQEPAIDAVPEDWLADLPGEMLVAIHLAFTEPPALTAPGAATGHPGEGAAKGHSAVDFRADPSAGLRYLETIFGHREVVGSAVAEERASVWTDFRIHGDGYSRMLVLSHGVEAGDAGYLIQRLLEVETYRMMALLGLPLAKQLTPRLSEVERRLGDITAEMNTHPDLNEPTTRGYLDRLTALAAETEDLAAATSYRFAATQAYSKLVERRLELMMETRLPSHEPISAYLARRLRPAVSTCEAVDRRIKDLAQRVARANDLLRTRVEVAQSAQSRDLLESMNTRAGLQLRLEQAVEVITVIAGTYYLASLVGFGAEALNVFGFTLDSGVVTGISAPAILIGLWAVIHRVQKAIKKAEGQH